MTTILNLPTEICCKIFEYLSIYDKVRVKLVCRYWKVILDGNKKLWSRLDFGGCVEETKRGFLTDTVFFHFITNLNTEVTFLSCFYCIELTGQGIVQAAQERGKLATLTSLNLSFTNLSDGIIYKLLSLLPNLIYLDLGEVSGITDISTLSVTRLKYLKFLRCTSINTTSNTIQLIVSAAKALELEELDIRGIPLPSGNFTKLIDKFKTLRTLKVTFLHAANYNELIVALDPKRSGRPCTLQFLCLCDDIDEIPSKILETIESFAISICNGKKYVHSYCSGELELLKMNETDL